MFPPPFVYRATLREVHDGDTLAVTVDFGMRRYEDTAVRLLNLACRELADPGGKEARDYVKTLLIPGQQLALYTAKPDKYSGRWDAAVTYMRGGELRDLATDIIAAGYGVPWDGRGAQPKPAWPRTTLTSS